MKNNWKDGTRAVIAANLWKFDDGTYFLGQTATRIIDHVEALIAEQKKELLLEVRTYIGDLDYEDMQTKGINQWVDEFIKSKGIEL